MDLGAYVNIGDLDRIAEKNKICVPRLRGYRLMSAEEPVNLKEIIDINDIAVNAVTLLCEATPYWSAHPEWYELSKLSDVRKHYYLVEDIDEDGWKHYSGVRWDRVHGRKRKILKTIIHNKVARIKKQYAVWNKYAGKENILYIHAIIGGGNWSYYHDEVDKQSWFIEKVDDSFDSTYCDIYAKLLSKSYKESEES